MSSRSSCCRRPDIRRFDGIRTCLACGTAVFESPSTEIAGDLSADSNTEGTQTYRYTKLNYELGQEIRLLVIQPGSEKDPVRCNIITVNLMDEPEYEALSYTWATEDGDESLSRVVYCDGLLTTLPITRNCEAALQRLRKLGLRRTIWIDAICIDQNNVAERNHQVALMGNIYRGASKVLVYLDCAEYNLTALFEWLRLREIIWEPSTSGLHLERRWRSISMLQEQVKELLSLRWFHRVWVIQEVALSRAALLMTRNDEVVLDGETITRLQDISSWKGKEGHFHKAKRHTVLSLPGPLQWMPGWREIQRPDLLGCLLATQYCSASDPRDKVFGILNLVDDEARSLVPVDYSLDIETIYMYAAASVILQKGNFSLFLYAHRRCDATLSTTPKTAPDSTAGELLPGSPSFRERNSATLWPSWVPDWHDISPSPLNQFAYTVYGNAIVRSSSSIDLVEASLSLSVTEDSGWSAQHPPSIPPTMKYCFRVKVRFLDFVKSRDWTSDIGLEHYSYLPAHPWLGFGCYGGPIEEFQDPEEFLEAGQYHEDDCYCAGAPTSWIYRLKPFMDFAVPGEHRLQSMQSVFGRSRHHYEKFLNAVNNLPIEARVYNVFRTEHSMGFADYSPTSWTKGDVVVALDGAHAPMILQSLGGNAYRIKCDCYLMAALEYDSWKQEGGRGPWGDLPDPVPEEEHTRTIDLY